MKDPPDSKRKSFSVFRSAREEAETKRGEQEWNNEGGAIRSTSGHVVHVEGTDRPYVVILRDGDSDLSEHAFATMREAEAFIKRSTVGIGACYGSHGLGDGYREPVSDQQVD